VRNGEPRRPASIAGDKLRARVAELFPAEDATEVAGHLAVLLGLPGQKTPDKQVLTGFAANLSGGHRRSLESSPGVAEVLAAR
jgi:hypothetical protein